MEEVKVEIKRYNPNYKSGLSEEEVNERISNNLINKDKTITKKSTLEIIVKNVFTFLNVVLFIIAIILMTFKQWTNCIFIVILLANLVIGLFQDFRAKKMVDKLSLMQKSKYTVIRNGKKVELYDNELVLDDVIILKGNDMIPCDSVVLEGSLQVNESVITGESKKIRKSYGDNLLSGSYVTSGEAYVRIDKIGEENYIKQLQLKSKEFKKPKSKLYVEINKIFKTITIIVVVLGLAQIIVTISTNLLNKELTYDVITKFIIVPISGAIISLIPSGMYLLFSTSLAAGVISLSKKNVLVQDMYSLDTLARVDTLCIDKTGTITDGTMVVSSYTIIDYFFENNVDFAEIISAFTHLIGDTNFTAEALKSYFNSDYNYKKESVIHFDSENKFSAITFKDFGTIVVGAYGFIKINNDNIDIKNKLDELQKTLLEF